MENIAIGVTYRAYGILNKTVINAIYATKIIK